MLRAMRVVQEVGMTQNVSACQLAAQKSKQSLIVCAMLVIITMVRQSLIQESFLRRM